MSTANLLLLLVGAVLLLLLLVMKVKLHAFIALLIVSLFTGLFAGLGLEDIVKSVEKGMGGTLGFLATVIGLGAMFGKMLEVSGGADRLARSFLRRFGLQRAPWAMLFAGFMVSIPVFFDVGFIILVPLVFALAASSKKSVLVFGIPLLAGLAVTHAFVPPTPGPILVANYLGADIGKVIIYGIIAGIPAAICAGPLWGSFIGKRINVPVPSFYDKANSDVPAKDEDLPSFTTVFLLILFPILLILSNTVASAFMSKDSALVPAFKFIGNPIIALIAACIVSFIVLGRFKGLTGDQIKSVCSSSLTSTGLIILVTGAGGVFKQVLIDTKIGDALAKSFEVVNINPIIPAFLLALIVRVAAGSATVAMTTSATIVSQLNMQGVEPALVVIAVASGATALSHVNDSGFWLVNRYFGLSEKDTFYSWTVMETIIGVVGLIMALLLNIVV